LLSNGAERQAGVHILLDVKVGLPFSVARSGQYMLQLSIIQVARRDAAKPNLSPLSSNLFRYFHELQSVCVRVEDRNGGIGRAAGAVQGAGVDYMQGAKVLVVLAVRVAVA